MKLDNRGGYISDSHTHCRHSHDTDYAPELMLNAAIAKGASYYAFTDHDDRDYFYTLPEYGEMPQLDLANHINEILELKKQYGDKIYVGLGIECSYAPKAHNKYIDDLSLTDKWDVILNSVHTVDGHDVYYPSYFELYGRQRAYIRYLEYVIDSLSVPYPYDVIAHLGYVTRKAPFGEKNPITMSEFGDYIDVILKGIIDRGVSLEINTHAKNTGEDFLPNIEIVKRYIELGGKDFTFGSDAHQDYRVLDKFDIVRDALLSLGIKYLNIYKKRVKTPLLL